MSSVYWQWMQTSVTLLNKDRNAAGVCDKGWGKKVPFHTQTKLKLSVILEAAVREQEDSDMEMKINLDMSSLLCLLLSFCFLWALLLLSHHIYSVFVFCFFQHFLVALQQKQRLFCFFNAPLLYAASAAWRQEIRFFFKWWIKCLLSLFYTACQGFSYYLLYPAFCVL